MEKTPCHYTSALAEHGLRELLGGAAAPERSRHHGVPGHLALPLVGSGSGMVKLTLDQEGVLIRSLGQHSAGSSSPP